MSAKKGSCLCGTVTFEYSGEQLWRGHCHCQSCRRTTSSPFTTFFGVPRSAYRFTGQAPAVYRSSPGVRRFFCGTCGSPIAYESRCYPEEMHFYAASLDDPSHFSPEFHVHCAEQLPWVKLSDGLPRFPRGSDEE